MFTSNTSHPIAIIIVIRDRFSMFSKCLDALYQNTSGSFRVIAVAGGADKETRNYLTQFQLQKKNFTVLFTEHFLQQAEARNLALQQVQERYCVILENDTIVHENWLPPLFNCMCEEKAAVVMPLIYWYRGLHTSGGTFIEWEKDEEIMFDNKILYTDIYRKPINYPESHCLLLDRQIIPTEIFEDVEPFDVDLGLTLRKLNLSVFLEPQSIVTYSAPPSLEVRDAAIFEFHWSPTAWEERNRRFNEKWGIKYTSRSKKISSYQRQQIKLGLAKWHANRLTIGISNFGMKLTNYLQTKISKTSNL